MKKQILPLIFVAAIAQAQVVTFQSGFQALAQNKYFFDLFNAVGSARTVVVNFVAFQKNFAAVVGVPFQMNLLRTTAAGTGGTVLTLVPMNSIAGSIPAEITVRHGATGGVVEGSIITSRFFHSEETNLAAQIQEGAGFMWPQAYFWRTMPIVVLNEGEGIAFKQITATTAGTYNVWVGITVQ